MTRADAAIVAPILAEILRPATAPRERIVCFRAVVQGPTPAQMVSALEALSADDRARVAAGDPVALGWLRNMSETIERKRAALGLPAEGGGK